MFGQQGWVEIGLVWTLGLGWVIGRGGCKKELRLNWVCLVVGKGLGGGGEVYWVVSRGGLGMLGRRNGWGDSVCWLGEAVPGGFGVGGGEEGGGIAERWAHISCAGTGAPLMTRTAPTHAAEMLLLGLSTSSTCVFRNGYTFMWPTQ